MNEVLGENPDQTEISAGMEPQTAPEQTDGVSDVEASQAEEYKKLFQAGELMYQLLEPGEGVDWKGIAAKPAPPESFFSFNERAIQILLRPFYRAEMTPERAKKIADALAHKLVENSGE